VARKDCLTISCVASSDVREATMTSSRSTGTERQERARKGVFMRDSSGGGAIARRPRLDNSWNTETAP